jgi:hypothetical protein
MKRTTFIAAVAIVAVLGMSSTALAAFGLPFGLGFDFGVFRDKQLALHSQFEYGSGRPVDASSTQQLTQAEAAADPTRLVTLANGLHARVVTTDGPAIYDQISLWPDDTHPTHMIVCNETDETDEPGLVRIDLATGAATTIVSGTTECDPTRRTPWGTIVFGEEDGREGRLYELLDPLHTEGVTLDRTTGTFSGGTGAENLVTRTAIGTMAFEGIGILPDGTTYFDGDDSDLGPHDGGPGDSYFKFIPSNPFHGTQPITSLSASPYAAGEMYGLRIGLENNYGQGREYGFGQWIHLPSVDNRDNEAAGLAAGLTGYYRSEDMDLDVVALGNGNVRACSPDTGDEENHLYGEVVCFTDGTVAQAEANTATPELQPFVIGGTSQGINMPDNIAFQPVRGNAVIHEDAETDFEGPHNNDLWDCLPDGKDQDLLSDGCARIGTLNDLTAEWTGGIFDASGKHLYVSVQHNISGKGTILDITGWH